jgi:hypothetical protein
VQVKVVVFNGRVGNALVPVTVTKYDSQFYTA